MKRLIIDAPEECITAPWNTETQTAWELEPCDIESLEDGQTLFRGDVGLYLEDEP